MKRFFHNELERYKSDLILMGERCIEVVRASTRALLEDNPDLAREAIKKDDIIDGLQVELDQEAIRYISMRAPVAKDLRLLTVGMKAAQDLERVGDEATNICKHILKVETGNLSGDFLHLPEMTTLVIEMLRDAIDSLVDGDLEKAHCISKRDNEVDRMHKENHANLANQIIKDSSTVHRALALIFVSRSLERIGDHATNIAEEVIYLYSAEDIRYPNQIREPKN